jgi:threonine dehydratase
MAGNGTIGLEIVEDLPDVDAVLVPWGGGGLTCGIASAVRAVRPEARVYACEVEGAAPLMAALGAGEPVPIDNRRTFVDGIGGRGVFPEIWPLARALVTGSLVATIEQVAAALRLIVTRAHVIAEGAGAAPLAAARANLTTLAPRPSRIVCVVSGGNIDATVLATILSGSIPA